MKPIFKPVEIALKKGNPKFVPYAIAAGVTAPILFSNKDRGPVDTALITTPLVAAGFVAGPGIVKAFKSSKQTAGQLFKQQATDDALHALYMTRRPNKAVDVSDAVRESVEKYLRELPDSSRALATHAMRRAQKRGLTLQQLVYSDVTQTMADPQGWTREQLLQVYERYKDNPRFVREFNRQLPKLNRFEKKAVVLASNEPFRATELKDKFARKEFNLATDADWSEFKRALGKDSVASELFKNRDAFQTRVTLISEKVTESSNRPVALLLRNDKRETLRLYLRDEATGTAKVGNRFNRLTAGRNVHFGGKGTMQILAPDAFIARHLKHDWKALRDEQLRLYVHHAADPDDAYDLFAKRDTLRLQLNPTSAKIRSMNAAASRLPVYVGPSGELVEFRKLGTDWKGDYFGAALRQGRAVVMASEGGFAQKGAVSDPRLSLIEPLGVPRASKQSHIVRAAGKPFDFVEDIPAELRPNAATTFFKKEILQGQQVPGVKATVGGITPGQREFFSEATARVRDQISKQAFSREVEAFGKGMFTDLKGNARWRKLYREYKNTTGIAGYKSWAKARATDILMSEETQNKLASVVEKSMGKSAKGLQDPRSVARYMTGLMLEDVDSFQVGELMAQLGEGDVAVNEGVFGKFNMMATKNVELQNHVEGLAERVIYDSEGKLKANWRDLLLGKDDLLGTFHDQFITGRGGRTPRMAVLGIDALENGNIRVRLGHVMNIAESSMKADIGGRKGLIRNAADRLFGKALALANEFSFQTGQGRTLSWDVNALALQPYHHANLATGDSLLNQIAETMRMMESEFGDAEAVREFQAKLARTHITRDAEGNLLELSEAVERLGDPYSPARRQRVAQLIEDTTDFFQKVEGHIKSKYGSVSPARFYRVPSLGKTKMPANAVQSFVSYLQANPEAAEQLGKGKDVFLNFLQRNHATDTMMFWDSSAWNVAKQATITYDQLAYMHRAGQYDLVQELKNRMIYPEGDPFQMAAFETYLQEGDFMKGYGLVERMPQSSIRGLTSPHGRAGTIFDPTDARYAGGFSVELDEAVEVSIDGKKHTLKYVPHAGWDAYGMQPHRYEGPNGEIKFSLKDHPVEKKFNAIWNARGEARGKAVQDYLEAHKNLISGPKGYRRARMVDPKAAAGFMRTTYVKSDSPFDVYVSDEVLESLPGDVARDLREGGTAYGTVLRQPTSDVSVSRIRYNPDLKLGENQLALGEGFRILKRSDDDLDRFILSVYTDQKSREFAERAAKAGSFQWEMYDTMRLLRNMEDTTNWNNDLLQSELEDAGNQLLNQLAKTAEYDREAKTLGKEATSAINLMRTRQAGSTVGHYSNFLTTLETAMLDHPTLKYNRDFVRRATPVLFAGTRQIPIALQKDAKGTLTSPLEHLDRIATAWANAPNSEQQAENFVRELSDLAGTAREYSVLNQEIVDKLSLRRGYIGKGLEAMDLTDAAGKLLPELRNKKVNVAKSLIDFQDDFRQQLMSLARDRSFRSTAAADSVLKNAKSLGQAMRRNRESLGVWSMLAEARPARSANEAAKMLGAANEGLRNAAKEVKAAMKPAAPILAAGLGIAAVAGLMFGGIGHRSGRASTPPPPSAGRWKPEEAVGASDHIPGEPVAGSAAPSSPKRVMAPQHPNVRTAVVGQMRPSHNMEVTMRGPDRSGYRETERNLDNLVSSGNTYVTKHYVGGWRQTSLRDRENLRNELRKHQTNS